MILNHGYLEYESHVASDKLLDIPTVMHFGHVISFRNTEYRKSADGKILSFYSLSLVLAAWTLAATSALSG